MSRVGPGATRRERFLELDESIHYRCTVRARPGSHKSRGAARHPRRPARGNYHRAHARWVPTERTTVDVDDDTGTRRPPTLHHGRRQAGRGLRRHRLQRAQPPRPGQRHHPRPRARGHRGAAVRPQRLRPAAARGDHPDRRRHRARHRQPVLHRGRPRRRGPAGRRRVHAHAQLVRRGPRARGPVPAAVRGARRAGRHGHAVRRLAGRPAGPAGPRHRRGPARHHVPGRRHLLGRGRRRARRRPGRRAPGQPRAHPHRVHQRAADHQAVRRPPRGRARRARRRRARPRRRRSSRSPSAR